ncbi:MAG: hypothetical protein R3F11_23020 [Verrucomicrobiales bacterium]
MFPDGYHPYADAPPTIQQQFWPTKEVPFIEVDTPRRIRHILAWAALHLHKEPSLEQRYISQISQLKYSYYGFSAYAEANNGRCPDSLGQQVDSRLLKYHRGVPEVDMLNALEGVFPNNISGHEPRDKKGCALFYFRFESMNRDSDDILIAVCAKVFLSGEPYRLVLKMNGKAEFISEEEFLLWVRQFNMLGDRDGKAKGSMPSHSLAWRDENVEFLGSVGSFRLKEKFMDADATVWGHRNQLK